MEKLNILYERICKEADEEKPIEAEAPVEEPQAEEKVDQPEEKPEVDDEPKEEVKEEPIPEPAPVDTPRKITVKNGDATMEINDKDLKIWMDKGWTRLESFKEAVNMLYR